MIIIIKRKILFLIFIIPILLITTTLVSSAVEEPDWPAYKEKNEAIIENDPADIMANYNYTIALVNLGEIKTAYRNINKFGSDFEEQYFVAKIVPYLFEISKHPDNILLLNYAAFYGVIVEDYSISIKYFEKILELTPQNYNIRNFLSASYLEQEDYEKAIKEANRALENKENEFSHLLLGAIHYEKGNMIKALSQLSKAGSLGRELLNNKK
ncbi:MAG: tetratricopeptide repeat protein [Halanaerobiales bacterium]